MADQEQMVPASSLELEKYLGPERALELSDPDKVSESIVREILNAETVEDLFSQSTTIQAEDIVQVPLNVQDLSFNPSDLGEGVGVYALIKAERLDTDETVLITCGSRNVMAQLFRAKEMGWLPLRVKITQTEKATRRGFRPMSLAPVVDQDLPFA